MEPEEAQDGREEEDLRWPQKRPANKHTTNSYARSLGQARNRRAQSTQIKRALAWLQRDLVGIQKRPSNAYKRALAWLQRDLIGIQKNPKIEAQEI